MGKRRKRDSVYCPVCGKRLRTPQSKARGMGSTCYKKHLAEVRKNKLF